MYLKQLFFCISICCSLNLFGQFDSSGPLIGIGIGTGYSTHASNYFTRLGAGGQVSFREYGGLRAIVLDGKIGWKFSKNIAVYGKVMQSPSNSTISPYSSTWLGGNIAAGLGSSYIFAGIGRHTARISDEDLQLSQTNLINLGFGFSFGPNINLDFNAFFGDMETENSLDPNPFEEANRELMGVMSVYYMIPFGGGDDDDSDEVDQY